MPMKSAARLLATIRPGRIGMWSGKSSAGTRRSASPSCHLLLPAGVAMLALVALAWARPAQAQAQTFYCWVGQQQAISFGTVNPGGAVSSTTLTFTCENNTGGEITYRVCPFATANGTPPGVAPRYMTNWGPEPYLQFDLFTNPTHTDIIGSLDSGHVPMGQSLFFSSNGQLSDTMTIYGRIPSGQNVAAGNYFSQNALHLKYAVRTGTTAPTDQECANGTRTDHQYLEVSASFANTCAITVATDLEFGNIPDLGQDRTSTSRISLLCPMRAAWDVGLDNGVHASGATRNMSGPNGALIEYELHRQPTHDDRWGNDIGVDTVSGFGTNAVQDLTVYGKVPFQTTMPAAGEYSDTVTVTLTF